MANLKASRGYYPVVALADTSQMPASPSSMSPGPRTPKGKGKGKKGKSRTKGPSPWQSKGAPVARGQAASKCLKCFQVGHWAINCPQNAASSKSSTASTSPSKRPKTDSTAMMVRDLAKKEDKGLEHLSSDGWYGLQDGGASSVVCGHTTLMRIVDYLKHKGVSPDNFKLLATNKTFGFGGDASRQADWSCRLPAWIDGKRGFMECFIVEGSTPLLIGRPILQALKIQMDYNDNKMSVQGGPWMAVPLGEKGEYLLRLDDGLPLQESLTESEVSFDFITDDSWKAVSPTMRTSTATSTSTSTWLLRIAILRGKPSMHETLRRSTPLLRASLVPPRRSRTPLRCDDP